jgi:hypothetical protein
MTQAAGAIRDKLPVALVEGASSSAQCPYVLSCPLCADGRGVTQILTKKEEDRTTNSNKVGHKTVTKPSRVNNVRESRHRP